MKQRKMVRLHSLFKKQGKRWKRIRKDAFTLPTAKAIYGRILGAGTEIRPITH